MQDMQGVQASLDANEEGLSGVPVGLGEAPNGKRHDIIQLRILFPCNQSINQSIK